jgi:GNAT superfamily N-acetyltransferase
MPMPVTMLVPVPAPVPAPVPVPVIASPDLVAIAAHADVEPSWQNSLASLGRAGAPYEVLGDEHGAAVVFPGSGDLPLLAVRPGARRRGHGTRLLQAAAARSSRPLRILNIDSRAGGIAAFLAAVGAIALGRQIEMVRAHGSRRAGDGRAGDGRAGD